MRLLGRVQVVAVWALDRMHRSIVGVISAVLGVDRVGCQVMNVREGWLDTAGPARQLLIAMMGWVAPQGEHPAHRADQGRVGASAPAGEAAESATRVTCDPSCCSGSRGGWRAAGRGLLAGSAWPGPRCGDSSRAILLPSYTRNPPRWPSARCPRQTSGST